MEAVPRGDEPRTMSELFVVEDPDGRMIDVEGAGGFSVFASRAEARAAADEEAANCDAARSLFTVVRYVRES
jgi:hypothetical protein